MIATAAEVAGSGLPSVHGVFGAIGIHCILLRIVACSSVTGFLESADNSWPLFPRICMFCNTFSDDPEIATNQKYGLHALPRTAWY